MPTTPIELLKTRLAELEAAIVETEKRLPAHSTKPPVMHDLLELEDERDRLQQELARLQDGVSEAS